MMMTYSLTTRAEDEVDISAETKDPFDITDTLPSITEALQLRKDVRDLTTKNKELTEALDLFVKLCDFVANRHTSGVHHSQVWVVCIRVFLLSYPVRIKVAIR